MLSALMPQEQGDRTWGTLMTVRVHVDNFREKKDKHFWVRRLVAWVGVAWRRVHRRLALPDANMRNTAGDHWQQYLDRFLVASIAR